MSRKFASNSALVLVQRKLEDLNFRFGQPVAQAVCTCSHLERTCFLSLVIDDHKPVTGSLIRNSASIYF